MEKKSYFIYGLRPTQKYSWRRETDELYNLVGHNTGNLAFHFAIDTQTQGGSRIVPWGEKVENVAKAGQIGIIPSANQVGEHADFAQFAKTLAQLKNTNLVSIGLGAQSNVAGQIPKVPQGTLNWIKEISDRSVSDSPNISVRGEFSLKVLEHYGLGKKAVVLGCPTLFINPEPKLGQLIAKNIRVPRRVAVAAGYIGWTHMQKLEASLVKIVTETHGSYVGQGPMEMVKLTRGEVTSLHPNVIKKAHQYMLPELSEEEFIRWTENYGTTFFDVPAWMEHYRHFDFVIGLRIHGIMLALQAGIPAICIVHDSRTLELCQTMKVPYVLASDIKDGITKDDLLKLFKFDADEFDANRKQLAQKYVQFLRNNHLEPVDWLVNIGK